MTSPADVAAALVATLGGINAETARACIEVIVRASREESRTVSRHRVGIVLDDLESAASDEDVWDVLARSPLFEETATGLRLTTATEVRLGSTAVERSDIVGLLLPAPAPARRQPMTAAALSRAVVDATVWGRSLLRYAAEQSLDGFPVFWDRVGDDSKPFGVDYGTMAATDTLLTAVEAGVAPLDDIAVRDLAYGWELLLDLGWHAPGEWYDGSIRFPRFDDDFVGTYLPATAQLGACPTLEAVANRSSGLTKLVGLSHDEPALAPFGRRSLEEIDAATRCVVRWQADSGGWAIHRYPPDVVVSDLPVRDVSCHYAVSALTDVAASELVSATTAKNAVAALQRFAEFLIAHAEDDGSHVSWRGDFVDGGDDARLRSTTLLTMVVGRLAAVLDAPELDRLQGRAARFLGTAWEPTDQGVFETVFRTPTWAGAALATFGWEMVRDGFVVSALLDADARGHRLDEADEGKIAFAVEGLVATCHRGSWLDVPMLREGKRRAFVSNTLHNLRALVAAADWMVRSLPRP